MIDLAPGILEALRAEADRAAPLECCGLLLGSANRVEAIRPAANVADDPRTRFEIDPRALIEAWRAERTDGPVLLGFYHSHPGGPARPSATDQALAPRDGRIWAIVGDGGTTFWRDGEDGFQPLSTRPLEG